MLDDRPIIEWQIAAMGLPDPIVVCRSEHAPMLIRYGEIVVNDDGRGAGDALGSAVHGPVGSDQIVVAYADTFFTGIPGGTDWVGVAEARGGRNWYVVSKTPGEEYVIHYEWVPSDEWTCVGVGLFGFSDPDRLRAITGKFGTEWRWRGEEWGLDVVVNTYGPWRPEYIESWQDVGDVASIEAWRPIPWQDR